MKANFLRLSVLGLLIASLSNNSWALFDDGNELTRVIVLGNRIWGIEITYDSAIVTPTSLFNPTHQPFRSALVTREYQEWREDVARATIDPLNTTDVRCSVIAVTSTKATTSKSDLTDRWLAASQLSTAIIAYKGLYGIKAAISASTPGMYNGTFHATFSITYIDGGSEKWVVAPGSTPRLLDANLPPPPDGDGVPKSSPITMGG